MGYFLAFECTCYILNDKNQLGKFDARSDKGIFLGYSINNVTYRVYNKMTRMVDLSVNIVFDEFSYTPKVMIINLDEEEHEENVGKRS